MKFVVLSCVAFVGLSACGGSKPTFDELQTDARRLYDIIDDQPRTTMGATRAELTGGANYTGVMYGGLSGEQIDGRVFTRAEMSVNVEFVGGNIPISGRIVNFVTEDGENLTGSLNFDGLIQPDRYRDATTLSTELTGNLESPGSGRQVTISGQIRGTLYGTNAGQIGGNVYDNSGELMLNGGWIVEQ